MYDLPNHAESTAQPSEQPSHGRRLISYADAQEASSEKQENEPAPKRRKRHQNRNDDDDIDQPTLSAVLPVSQHYNASQGPPTSGEEFLKYARDEAQWMPHVQSAAVPRRRLFDIEATKAPAWQHALSQLSASPTLSSTRAMPSREWRVHFKRQFELMRATRAVSLDFRQAWQRQNAVPSFKDAQDWWTLLYSESDNKTMINQLLAHLTQPQLLSLLELHCDWLDDRQMDLDEAQVRLLLF
jgi:hypothetical protein